MRRTLLYALAFLASAHALAQQGDGVPVSPNPFVEVHIDEEHACEPAQSLQGASSPVTADQLCGDFEASEIFKKNDEREIGEAREACKVFYKNALRLQNVFCSYTKDEELYRQAIERQADRAVRAESIGQVSESQHIVAGVNRVTAGLNQKYMERIAKVGTEFDESYTVYLQKLGKLNSIAGFGLYREANCIGQPRPMNLDLKSDAPGHLLELLVTASHATAYATFHFVIDLTRHNYAELRVAKEKAVQNVERAALNANIAVPTIFTDALSRNPIGGDGSQPLTPAEGAMYSAFQDLITRGIKAKFGPSVPMLAGPLGSIVGGGIVVFWQWKSNKRVMYPETAATFMGMINPYAGMAASILVGAYRTSEARVAEYRDFTINTLKGKVNVAAVEGQTLNSNNRQPGSINTTAAQVVEAWAQYKKAPACVDAAKIEARCVAIRPTLPRYSGSNCARSALDRPRDSGSGRMAPSRSTISTPPQR